MTMMQLVRMAWAGAVVAATVAFLYLGLAPIPASHSLDRGIAIGLAMFGAVAGAVVERRIEKAFDATGAEGKAIPLHRTVETREPATRAS